MSIIIGRSGITLLTKCQGYSFIASGFMFSVTVTAHSKNNIPIALNSSFIFNIRPVCVQIDSFNKRYAV